jgi:hypothetical protein
MADILCRSPVLIYPPHNSTLDAIASKAGHEMRHILHKADINMREGIHAYVNYAHGDESLEEIYGFERWRLEKLRKLKREWVSQNKFGYYAGI